MVSFIQSEFEMLRQAQTAKLTGRVRSVIGLVVECEGIQVPIGSLCRIYPAIGERPIEAEAVGIREENVLLMPYGELLGIRRHDRVECVSNTQVVKTGEELLGRVVNARGLTIDGGPSVLASHKYQIYSTPPPPLSRTRITEPLETGINAIDALITCGKGQRIGLFSGSGIGKSILMGMIARNTSADINVICLIGERGREVREFIERDLGTEGLKRSVVVVATSDEPTLMRTKAPFTASAIAEYFRDQGKDVLLLMDSITRLSNAQREIGLSIGEPPATKGYPPSTFAQMPKLLERAGTSSAGSITGIYTVLVEADDINEPIADAARGILDGHIWLSRNLAAKGHYPAIDPLTSISRLMIDVVTDTHYKASIRLKAIMNTYKNSEDLINIGAYVKGTNPDIDNAIQMMPEINKFLRQDIFGKKPFETIVNNLLELTG